MSGLTRKERGRIIKSSLMVLVGITLVMVLFALIGRLIPITFILAVAGIVMVIASSALVLLRQSALVVYSTMAIGLTILVGAAGGSFIINMVTASRH